VADITQILSSNYLAAASNVTTSNTKYVPVDASQYQGTWSGQYGDGSKFSVQVSNVVGFRARVHYQSGSSSTYGDVLIKDSSFRIGDSKFVLATPGTAVVSAVTTDAMTGSSIVKRGYASQS
jgi:hypothetical protein